MSQLASSLQEVFASFHLELIFVFFFLGLSWSTLLLSKVLLAIAHYGEYGELPLSPEKLKIKQLQEANLLLIKRLEQAEQERDEANTELKSSLSSLLKQISR